MQGLLLGVKIGGREEHSKEEMFSLRVGMRLDVRVEISVCSLAKVHKYPVRKQRVLTK